MSKLKELTWENHQRAERTEFARKLLKGLSPVEYHKYLLNQHYIYHSLETAANEILNEFPAMRRSDKIKLDLEELEVTYSLGKDPTMITNIAEKYSYYVSTLDNSQLLAHLYVRHFGDMYGGQMIKKRNPGRGQMYDFDDVENLKLNFRALLNDDMADEANRCFNFAMELFEELDE